MYKILFVCHGNICRSPMAEFITKKLLVEYNCQKKCLVNSAAISSEELGNSIYPPALKTLQNHAIFNAFHQSHQTTAIDYEHYDLIFCMDKKNLTALNRLFNNDPKGKISMFLPYDVPDPWYTGEFEKVYEILEKGCSLLVKKVCQNEPIRNTPLE